MPLARGPDGRLGVVRAAAAATSRSRSRRRTPTVSAARKATSPGRSPAPSRAASARLRQGDMPMTAFHEVAVSARHRAEERGRAGAAHRHRHARLRPRGAQRALGAFAPALRRRLRRQDARRRCRPWSRSSRSGADNCMAFAGATGSIILERAGARNRRRSIRRSARATARPRRFSCEDLWQRVRAVSRADRQAGRGQRARRGRRRRERRATAFACDTTTGRVTFLRGHISRRRARR